MHNISIDNLPIVKRVKKEKLYLIISDKIWTKVKWKNNIYLPDVYANSDINPLHVQSRKARPKRPYISIAI